MIMDSAKELARLVAAYTTCWDANLDIDREAHVLLSAVAERIEAMKEKDAIRIAELEATVSDKSRSMTVRRVAEMDLAALKQTQYSPTKEEREAFEDVIARWNQGVSDARTLGIDLKQAINDCRKAIDGAISVTIGNQRYDSGQHEMYIQNAERKFSALK